MDWLHLSLVHVHGDGAYSPAAAPVCSSPDDSCFACDNPWFPGCTSCMSRKNQVSSTLVQREKRIHPQRLLRQGHK